MGTETMQLQVAAAVAVGAGCGGQHQQQHHYHNQQQQRQHNHANAHPQPYHLIDAGGAFGGLDSVKDTGDAHHTSPAHADVFGNSHPHIQPPPTGAVKFPPVVGIYRPPAARRALKLAENAIHQLAPPAACEHPNDYAHVTSPGSTAAAPPPPPPRQRPQQQHHSAGHHLPVDTTLTLDATRAAAEAVTTADKPAESAAATFLSSPDSTEGSPVEKDEQKAGAKTGSPLENAYCSSTNSSSSSSTTTKCATQASPTVPDGGSVSDRVVGSVTADSSVVSSSSARVNRPHRERRPDRAVYIPRARRSLTTPPVTTSSSLLPEAAGARETVSKETASIAPTPVGSPPKRSRGGIASSANRTHPPRLEIESVAVTTETSSSSSGPSACPVASSEGGAVGSKGENHQGKQQRSPPVTAAAAAGVSSVEPASSGRGQLQSNKSIPNCDSVIEGAGLAKGRTSTHFGDQGAPVVDAFKRRSYSLEEPDHRHNVSSSVVNDRLDILTEAASGLDTPRQHGKSSAGQESFNGSCDFHQPPPEGQEAPAEVVYCTVAGKHPAEGLLVGLEQKSIEASDTMQRNNNRNRNAKNVATLPMNGGTMIINHERPTEGDKIDHDEKELRRAAQEMNRSNRRLMKQTFNSDVLEIGEPTPAAPPKPSVGKKAAERKKEVQNGGDSAAPHKPFGVALPTNGSNSNGGSPNGKSSDGDEPAEEEDDWESMYDDNGDCLNPKMLDELTTAVGKVAIEVPQSDYKAFQTKQAVLNEEEFPHVLEVSNFPAEFKTQDLMMLFSQYKESGFDIKWVDDTHALAVFSSSKIAAEILATGSSFAQVKPLAEATAESRSKARKCASSLQPYRARPETCAALARRLVTTALGVRLKTAPEERENERRVLREAKERKLLAAKQRDELWES